MGNCCGSRRDEGLGAKMEKKEEVKEIPKVVTNPVAKAAPPAKKKFNRADFMFKKEEGKTLSKKPGDINGMQFKIADLENCTVFLVDHLADITIDRCKNTKFYIGPVKASLFIRDCENCEVTISCQQFRCRDLKNSTLYLYTA